MINIYHLLLDFELIVDVDVSRLVALAKHLHRGTSTKSSNASSNDHQHLHNDKMILAP